MVPVAAAAVGQGQARGPVSGSLRQIFGQAAGLVRGGELVAGGEQFGQDGQVASGGNQVQGGGQVVLHLAENGVGLDGGDCQVLHER